MPGNLTLSINELIRSCFSSRKGDTWTQNSTHLSLLYSSNKEQSQVLTLWFVNSKLQTVSSFVFGFVFWFVLTSVCFSLHSLFWQSGWKARNQMVVRTSPFKFFLWERGKIANPTPSSIVFTIDIPTSCVQSLYLITTASALLQKADREKQDVGKGKNKKQEGERNGEMDGLCLPRETYTWLLELMIRS